MTPHDEIEPCPFCREQPQRDIVLGVKCYDPDCVLHGYWLDADKWNTRATDTTLLELSERLRVAEEALRKIAKRPDLPNPERDADWMNCMKWSSFEAAEALQRITAPLDGVKGEK